MLNGWWIKGVLIGCVVMIFTTIVAHILGRMLDTRSEYFWFLVPMVMGYSMPVSYKIGVKSVANKEKLEPISCDRIKKKIRRQFYYQIAFSLIFISLAIGVFFCSKLYSYAVFRFMSGLINSVFLSWGMCFALILPLPYKQGIEDMQKIIAERQDSQVNVV